MTLSKLSAMDQHEDYTRMQRWVKLVRDCIAGEPEVKRNRKTYLKHPNAFDETSPQQAARYEAYLDGAEFDDYPKNTLASMLGQMTAGELVADLPDKIAYLSENADGDGMPLSGLVELVYSNVLQVKTHILVAEYQGLGDVDIDKVSIADLKEANPRASIKQYTRESLIDWDFTRPNGVMQLSLLVLVEEGHKRDENLNKSGMRSYLVLALDENGEYYQRKYIESENAAVPDGERHYPLVGGQRLKWIPAEIVVDEETPAGMMPTGLGHLYPVCAASLYSYRISADYKEALRHMQPTTFTSGWKEGDWELFKTLNSRDYIAFGAGVSNNLPEGVEIKIEGMGVAAEPFERYFDRSIKKSRALGARIPGESRANQTATEIRSDDRNTNAVMVSIVKNTEAALRRIISYCAMYEGLWGADQVETSLDQISISLPIEFGKANMSPEEINAVLSAYTGGLMSKQEAVRKLVAGGFYVSDAETVLDELESDGPRPSATGMLPGTAPQDLGDEP